MRATKKLGKTTMSSFLYIFYTAKTNQELGDPFKQSQGFV